MGVAQRGNLGQRNRSLKSIDPLVRLSYTSRQSGVAEGRGRRRGLLFKPANLSSSAYWAEERPPPPPPLGADRRDDGSSQHAGDLAVRPTLGRLRRIIVGSPFGQIFDGGERLGHRRSRSRAG